MIRTHESRSYPGAFIASLALPWGFSKGDKDQGGYHLVWARDMVGAAGGLLAAHAHEDARRALAFLQSTEYPDGHWAQNMWLDGSPYWDGVQMDETALPILLVDLAYREKALHNVSDTDWARGHQVSGYYIRTAPVKKGESSSNLADKVHIKNVPTANAIHTAGHLISPDALTLVRFGLRAANDPFIKDTVKIIDDLLKIETPTGPTWHRYNDNGYGEHTDGKPFNGTGIGRGCPLLTGERAHCELMAGHTAQAEVLKGALQSFANEGGFIPEQVWDHPDIPERELYFGRPSGSAMPLVCANTEYLKLQRSLLDRNVFDLPPQTVHRYLEVKTVSSRRICKFNHKLRRLAAGTQLRIETLAAATIRWTSDDWNTWQNEKKRPGPRYALCRPRHHKILTKK